LRANIYSLKLLDLDHFYLGFQYSISHFLVCHQ